MWVGGRERVRSSVFPPFPPYCPRQPLKRQRRPPPPPDTSHPTFYRASLDCFNSPLSPPPPSPPPLSPPPTRRPDAIDPALRRAGRFDREIALGIPDEAARTRILKVLSKRLRLSGDVDFAAIAKRTPGYVGADLAALAQARY